MVLDILTAGQDRRLVPLKMIRVRPFVPVADSESPMSAIHLLQQAPVVTRAPGLDYDCILFDFYDYKIFLVDGFHVCTVYHNMSKTLI